MVVWRLRLYRDYDKKFMEVSAEDTGRDFPSTEMVWSTRWLKL